MKLRYLFAAAIVLVACGDPTPTPPGGEDAATPPPVGCVTDEECTDGTFCNGVEQCQPANPAADGRGCVEAAEPACPMAAQVCDEEMDRCTTQCDVSADADGDGADAPECGGRDCDDGDPLRSPSAVEVCDAEDRDEDCDLSTFGARDSDRDTYVDASCCNVAADGTRTCGDDCDDFAASVSPVGTEVCNERDDDCNGGIDEGVTVAGFRDADGDQHGDPATPIDACPGASRFSTTSDDCDDGNNRRHGAQVEVCDGLDNDCDGTTDETTRAVTWYRDEDRDGFGSAAGGTRIACEPPDGYELLPIDCDDTRAGVSPIAVEACNGRDDDCDGDADFVIGVGDSEDDDDDGFVDVACGGLGDDCDDSDPSVHPGGEPYCDGRDHDCDGEIDVGAPLSWWRDEDGDGFGAGAPMTACEPPIGYVRRDGDCDDSLPNRSPAEPDDCDGIDDDCDVEIDEDSTRIAFYPDGDGDGAGGGAPVLACAQPFGHGIYPTDCDDADPLRFEGAPETCDGQDNDCDALADEPDDVVCRLPNAGAATCTAGACEITTCAAGFADCNAIDSDGCETDTRTDLASCGACGNACGSGPMSTTACVDGECVLTCDAGSADCDANASNGCESVLATDPEDCGSCGWRCAPRPHAPATCTAGVCGTACETGWRDCDGMPATGCETDVMYDRENCGGCAIACPLATDLCVRGMCVGPAFESDGSDGPFEPTADTVLPAGVHHFTTIRIPAGVTVTTDGTARLELRATGDVVIEGTIELTGGRGGGQCRGNSGGWTGQPRDAIGDACGLPPAGGGEGGAGGAGPCGLGGAFGGGGTGAGGGGYAGGAGGDGGGGRQGAGGSVPPLSHGGVGDGQGGAPALLMTPLAMYAGNAGCLGNGQAGGGSIGEDAAMDLAMASTFRPGSGGGGGRGGGVCPNGGGGGGGGGGAVRIASATRIRITTTGIIRANGGSGNGGGSGGAIYLAAPEIDSRGVVSAVGGQGATVAASCLLGAASGDGGLGRIRLSVLPERCTLFGSFSPVLPVTGCARTPGAGVPGRVYIDTYPF